MSTKNEIRAAFNTLPNIIYGLVLLGAASFAAGNTLIGAAEEGRMTDEVLGIATLAFVLAWSRGAVTLLRPSKLRAVATLTLATILALAFRCSLGTMEAPACYWALFGVVLVTSTLPDFFTPGPKKQAEPAPKPQNILNP